MEMEKIEALKKYIINFSLCILVQKSYEYPYIQNKKESKRVIRSFTFFFE